MGVWDVATPSGSDPILQGDDRIREMKVAIQEALRGGASEGTEAVFPGGSPSSAPIFRYRGLKGTTAARPAAGTGGLYVNTTTKTLQRDSGSAWEDIYPSAETMAIHQAAPASLASIAGVITLPETGNSFNVTGTETITAFAGWTAGLVIVKWASARIITHSASLTLMGSRSRNVIADDISIFEFTGSGAAVREVNFHGAGGGIETGSVIMHAGASVPSSFLECNGASLLRADYPGLFSVIGTVHGTASGTTFNLPDLRGRFVRGRDNGAGNDPDAASRTAANTGGATGDNVGSLQDDQFEAHTHSTPTQNGTAQAGGSAGAQPTGVTGSAGGNETRPKNIGLMYCIKF